MKLNFKLSKKAKSGGGDKYDCETIEGFNIYFPQTISRKNNKPIEILEITINNLEKDADTTEERFVLE